VYGSNRVPDRRARFRRAVVARAGRSRAMTAKRSRNWRGSAVRLAVLLVVPAVAAVLTAWWHPRGPDWTVLRAEVSRVSVAEVAGVADVLWVDARDPEAFAAG